MTAMVLITGTLFRPPEQRTSKAGKPFVTATVRAKDGDPSAGSGQASGTAALAGVMPLEIMLQAMRLYWEAGQRDKAVAIAKDAAPYIHPRMASIDVGGKPGAPIETKDVTNTELARRIAFILGQAARDRAEETPLAASVASNGHSTVVS